MDKKFDLESSRNKDILELFIDVYNHDGISGLILVREDETLASIVSGRKHEDTALAIMRAFDPDFKFEKKPFMDDLTDKGNIVILLISGVNPLVYIPSEVTDYQKDALGHIHECSELMNTLANIHKINFNEAFKMDKGGLFEPHVRMNGQSAESTLEDALEILEESKKVK